VSEPLSLAPSGRRVLVTGAAGGIGRAVVAALVSCDCQVAACDAVGQVDDVPGAAARAVFDVRDREACRAAVADVAEQLGGLDAVVANAGVVDTIHRAERFSGAEWDKDVDTNLSGQFHVVQAAFDALAGGGDGRIVLISSVAAETGLPGQVAYSAAKAGVVGMARTLAGEWGPRGVRCNVVMPGMIGTPKVQALPDAVKAGLSRTIPLGRLGAVEELAGAVVFLLSPAAAYVNGAVLRVDGGFGLSTGGLMTGSNQ
jgi:3-oxoacyl-[acyl-carrier protein] reductase